MKLKNISVEKIAKNLYIIEGFTEDGKYCCDIVFSKYAEPKTPKNLYCSTV